ncbi:MAG: hypothetical protein Q3966_08815 [Neisseria sp.]|nr:hypothetical protein [Neisseria sp.]
MTRKTAAALIAIICAHAHAAQPYRLSDYPAGRVYQGKRHPPEITRQWRTKLAVILDGYADKGKKVDFAGSYTTVVWGCGTGCAEGVMVDARDGTIHDLSPVRASDEMLPCLLPDGSEAEGDLFQYRADSRLFTVYTCRFQPIEGGRKYLQWRTDYFYEWRERRKKFVLLKKTVEKSIVPAS